MLVAGPDAETTVSLLAAIEEATEAGLRTALLGRLSAPPGTLHIRGMAIGSQVARRCKPEPDRPPTTQPADLGMWPTGSRGSMGEPGTARQRAKAARGLPTAFRPYTPRSQNGIEEKAWLVI